MSEPTTGELPTLLEVPEIAAYLGVSEFHVGELLRDPTSGLNGFKAGRQWRMTADSLAAYVNGRTAAAPTHGRATASAGRARRSA